MKYKIKYKAQDSLNDTIINWFLDRGWTVETSGQELIEFLNADKDVLISVYPEIKIVECELVEVVEEGIGATGMYYGFNTKLTKDQLLFFDNLDFSLSDKQMQETNQEMEDWF